MPGRCAALWSRLGACWPRNADRIRAGRRNRSCMLRRKPARLRHSSGFLKATPAPKSTGRGGVGVSSTLPTLRIRCPKCRTVQRVSIGSTPTCPCGFSGRKPNTSAASHHQEAPEGHNAWSSAPAAGGSWSDDAQDAQWGEAPTQWDEAPAQWQDEPADPDKTTSTPERGGPQVTWDTAPEPWPEEAPPQPKKKGLFRRK